MCFVDTERLWDQEGKKLPSTEVLTIVTKKTAEVQISEKLWEKVKCVKQ